MSERNRFLFCLIFVVFLLWIGSIFLMSDSDKSEDVIYVSCEDKVDGELFIREWKNIEKNKDGQYFLSDFLTEDDGEVTGELHSIQMKNGQAEYFINKNTRVFMLDDKIINIHPKSHANIKVEYKHHNKSVLISNQPINNLDECSVSFGLDLFNRRGLSLSDHDLITSTPDLKSELIHYSFF